MISNKTSQIARFMGPTWGPPGSCWPHVGPCWPHEPCYQGWYLAANWWLPGHTPGLPTWLVSASHRVQINWATTCWPGQLAGVARSDILAWIYTKKQWRVGTHRAHFSIEFMRQDHNHGKTVPVGYLQLWHTVSRTFGRKHHFYTIPKATKQPWKMPTMDKVVWMSPWAT